VAWTVEKARASKRAWHARNKQRSREITQAWKAANPGVIARYNAAYRCACKQRTPTWADVAAINAVYLRSQAYGLTVDHVIPLRGKYVSGLHVESNLRLLERKENASKGNRL